MLGAKVTGLSDATVACPRETQDTSSLLTAESRLKEKVIRIENKREPYKQKVLIDVK